MKYDIHWLQQRLTEGWEPEYTLFWGHDRRNDGSLGKECLSQWYDCRFTADGTEYHTAEQYMMAQKAILFGDRKTLEKIMAAPGPREMKNLGRKVKGFDERVWEAHCREIVVKGNLAKFSSNRYLTDFLFLTGRDVLAEASPYDRIWGIGLSQEDENARDPFRWRGTNFLGFCLMEVRDILMAE